jgi:DNA-nicking Smr family endonuclease
MTACKSFIKKAFDKKAKKIVLIHGKGEGILKAEIHLVSEQNENRNGDQTFVS